MAKWNKSLLKEIQKYKTDRGNSLTEATDKALNELSDFIKSLKKLPSENKSSYIFTQLEILIFRVKILNIDSLDKSFIRSKINSVIANLQKEHDLSSHDVENFLNYADNLTKEKKRHELIQPQDVALEKALGSGNFGEVNLYRVINPAKLKLLRAMGLISNDSDKIAIKTLTTSSAEGIKEFKFEGSINQQLYKGRNNYLQLHPQAICHYNYAVSSFGLGEKELLLSKFESAGSAAQYINKWRAQMNLKSIDSESIKDTLLLFIMLISDAWQGMNEVHHLGIIHGDLSIHNILIDEIDPVNNSVVAKLSDFGLSQFFNVNSPNAGLAMSKDIRYQIRRANMERLSDNQLSIATDLYGFKVMVMEMIAYMAGLDFQKILFSINPVQFYKQPNPNDLMLKKMAELLCQQLEQDTVCPALSHALKEVLAQLGGFLSWEEGLTFSQQQERANLKLKGELATLTGNIENILVSSASTKQDDLDNNNNSPTVQPQSSSYNKSPTVLQKQSALNAVNSPEFHDEGSDAFSADVAQPANSYSESPVLNDNNNNSITSPNLPQSPELNAIRTRAKRAVSNFFGEKLSLAGEPSPSTMFQAPQQGPEKKADQEAYGYSPVLNNRN